MISTFDQYKYSCDIVHRWGTDSEMQDAFCACSPSQSGLATFQRLVRQQPLLDGAARDQSFQTLKAWRIQA